MDGSFESEQRRLLCLRTLGILDTPADPALDALTRAVAAQLGCPIALVSLVDEHRQWFKAHHGLAAEQTPREWAFCAHTLADQQMLEVPDARTDARFRDNPLVTGEPGIRFYVGAPLVVNGQAIGTLCAIDRQPRQLAPQDRQALTELAAVAVAVIERAAAQRRTELSEARLSDMVRAASDFLWEIDHAYRFTWVSDGVQALLGVPAADLIGQPIWNPVLRDSLGQPLAGQPTLHLRLAAEPATLRQFVELPTVGAGLPPHRPVLLSAVPVVGAGNALLGWRGTAKDATRLLDGARRSNELESRLAQIAAQLPGVIFVLERQPDGHLSLPYASQRLRDIFDLEPAAVVGDALALLSRVPAAQRSEMLRDLVRSAECGTAWSFECCLEQPGAADRWVGGRATPSQSADGRQVWYGYAADFTERRDAAQAMVSAQRRLQQALDVGCLGVVTFDRATGAVAADSAACAMHGLVGGAANAQPLAAWLAQIDPADHAALQRAMAGANTRAAPTELSYRRAGASPAALIELRLEAAGSAGELLGLCRDITVQERASQALREKASAEQVQQKQTEFLSRVSHELRTPMNAILGFVDLMRSDDATPLSDQHRQWTGHVMGAGQRLMSLINDLLDLTRIESGHHALALHSWPVLRLIDASHGLLLPLAQRNRVSLATPAGDTAVQVRADRRGLEQVLVNVVANAIKFSPPDSVVTTQVEARDGYCLIQICDDGPGVAPERRERLFRPFERLGRAQGSAEGSGLGLAISRRLVLAMDGRISASFPPRGGTCIDIELPLACKDDSAGPDTGVGSLAPALPPVGDAARAPRRALYAEDNPVNTLVLRAMFELRSDWTLDTVETGAALRAAAARTRYDLVILDIHLGRESGIDLVRELRRDPAYRDVTCVALSADGLPEQAAAALAAGFSAYWTKPVALDELHRRLDQLSLLQ